jgi:hypothetical protein
MTAAPRFHLKCASGWFAAGAEVEAAVRLLSDAAFKLFVWLCLHAERTRGCIAATPVELGRALQRSEAEVQTNLQELLQKGICLWRSDGLLEIADRFWPYQRTRDPASHDEQRVYINRVKLCLLQRSCVRSVFTAADEKLAGHLARLASQILRVDESRRRHTHHNLVLLHGPVRRGTAGSLRSVLALRRLQGPNSGTAFQRFTGTHLPVQNRDEIMLTLTSIPHIRPPPA